MADLISMLAAAAGAGGVTPAGYQISRSLRFNSADSAYLNRTPASAGNRRTWTWSGWVKRGSISATNPAIFAVQVDGNNQFVIRFDTDTALRVYDFQSSAFVFSYKTSALYRDPSSWYHIVVAVDTTNATSADRVIIYVNGQRITDLSLNTAPTQNADGLINTTNEHTIGTKATAEYFSGYMTEINFIDGQQLTPTSFGETNATTGVWSPIRYAGSYGTNGFYLNFSDNSGVTSTTLGKDQAGSNNWTPNNFSVTAGAGNDSLVDTPTPYGTDTGAGGEVRGNYCTLNALDRSLLPLSEGNLGFSPTGGTWENVRSTHFITSGKWYWEVTCNTYVSGGAPWSFGVTTSKAALSTSDIAASNTDGSAYTSDGQKRQNGSSTAYGSTYSTGDIIGVALDMDSGKIWFAKNGIWQASGDPAAGTNAAFTNLSGLNLSPAVGLYGGETSGVAYINFGQRPFAYTAPSGFKALVTTNLPDPTVVQGDDYFNTVLYTGTGSSLGVTGVGFQPDFVWIKERNAAADHGLYDAVRGTTKQLESNTSTAETTEATGLTTFGTDGFTVGALAQLNTSADTYVAWNWKANGAGVSNTDGTITSTVSASIDSGFSIVTYTGNGIAGATVGHGLGVAPKMLIVKGRSTSYDWRVYHASVGNGYIGFINTTAAFSANTTWDDTTPSSTVFTLGSELGANQNSATHVAYCFAEVEGFSKFGSLTGNGSADGPFVFLGFRPAFVMLKRTDSTSNWTILDLKREGYNVDNDPLFPNLSNAEGTTDLADLLSNGFKLRSTDASVNASAATYIFAAFSAFPFKTSLAR